MRLGLPTMDELGTRIYWDRLSDSHPPSAAGTANSTRRAYRYISPAVYQAAISATHDR